jgi:hypothetical protein
MSLLLHFITIHVCAAMLLPFFWSILLNMLLSSARLQAKGQIYIQRQAEHAFSSAAIVTTSHGIALYLQSDTLLMHISIHSQQETLICTLSQQGSLAVAPIVLSFLLSLLIYAFGV